MKAFVERAPLLAALGRIVGVVERRQVIPIIGNVALTFSEGRLELRGTDLDMEAEEVVSAQVETPGAFTVPADKLHDICRNADAGAEIVFSTTDDDPRVKIAAGRARFNVQSLPIDDFPKFLIEGLSEPWSVRGKTLADMLSRVSFARGALDPLTAMSGIHLNVVGGELHAVACHGSGIALRREPAPEGAAICATVLPKFTNQVGRWAAELDGDVQVSSSPGLVRIQSGDSVITTKVYDGPYFAYDRILMDSHTLSARTDQDAMLTGIKRAMIMAPPKAASVRLAFADGGITLSARHAESGDGADEIGCDFEGAETDFLLSADALRSAIESLRGDVMELGFEPTYVAGETATANVLIRAPADPKFIANLMQMRA